jgi:hypothetical protein
MTEAPSLILALEIAALDGNLSKVTINVFKSLADIFKVKA